MNHARAAAVRVVQRLQDNGFVAYLAGGCVRDTLLGRPPKDFDVATNAEPDRIAELFTTSHAVGEAFGVQLVPVREALFDAAEAILQESIDTSLSPALSPAAAMAARSPRGKPVRGCPRPPGGRF